MTCKNQKKILFEYKKTLFLSKNRVIGMKKSENDNTIRANFFVGFVKKHR